MKLVELKCKNCGATLKADPEQNEMTCKYCQTTFKIDDEVKHVKFDDMEQNGYEFEKGRIRAQQESKATANTNVTYAQPQKKNNKTLWLVLAWIFLLPFTATYFIAKSNKLDKKKKIIIIAVMWVVFIIIGVTGSIQEEADKKDKIIKCYSQETYDKLDELIGMDNINGYFSDSYTCDEMKLKNKNYKNIEIEMDKEQLISIKLDNKYIYNIDPSIDIYDPDTMKQKENTANIPEIYKDDKSINLFINKYNKNYDPDIDSTMISKKHIGGKDHDDVVNISNNDKLEIILYGSSQYSSEYKMSVYIGYRAKVESTNDDFKIEFIKYIKLFDEKLSDEEISKYWEDMISEYRSSYKINDIEIMPNVVNGKVEYFKITSNIKFY